MQVTLIKVPFDYTDKNKQVRKGYNFFLRLENGSMVKIQPNTFKDSKGNSHNNQNVLLTIASEQLPF